MRWWTMTRMKQHRLPQTVRTHFWPEKTFWTLENYTFLSKLQHLAVKKRQKEKKLKNQLPKIARHRITTMLMVIVRVWYPHRHLQNDKKSVKKENKIPYEVRIRKLKKPFHISPNGMWHVTNGSTKNCAKSIFKRVFSMEASFRMSIVMLPLDIYLPQR